jgi:hypothetical protein
MDNRNQQRKPDIDERQKDPKNLIKTEARNLFKYGKTKLNFKDLAELRKRVSNAQLVESIYEEYTRQYNQIVRQAEKFAKLIVEKYGTDRYPMHKVIEKALKYKEKLEMSDSAFQIFKTLYEERVEGRQIHGMANYKTIVGKTLGEDNVENIAKLELSDKDYPFLDAIMDLYQQSRVVYDQVVLQSIAYKDCAIQAVTGTFDKAKFNPANHIHPLLAALYLIKIPLLEEHTLFANIGYIIKCKSEGMPINTKPNFELYWDMVRDPNDQVCNIDSVMADLKNRFLLQIKIWESVIPLRLGQYYGMTMPGFLQMMDNCRINMHDTPELIYVRDEGSMLKKFLCAFSLRPTVVTTSPLYGVISTNPYDSARFAPVLKQIPMLNIRFPPPSVNNQNMPVRLLDSLEQGHWYFENNTLVPKSQNILYSRDVIFFYANRRYFHNDPMLFTQPFTFSSLPLTTSGYENLNDRRVHFEMSVDVRNDTFELRSIVCVERTKIGNGRDEVNLITGTSAIIVKPPNLEEGNVGTAYLLYNPMISANQDIDNGRPFNVPPITALPFDVPVDAAERERTETFYEKASRTGTIFVYVRRERNPGLVN